MSANAHRGEDEIVLAGVPYLLRPSHAAIVAAETKTQHSLLELVKLANAHALTFTHIGTIAAEFIRAGAKPDDKMTAAVSAERIAELVHEEGVVTVVAHLAKLLVEVARGGRTASGEAKAAAANPTGTAGAA